MAVDTDLCFQPIADLERAYRGRALSPVEVIEAYLQRIEALDDRLHAYITVTSDRARATARASEGRYARGEALGPLDGVPYALKDLFDTAGVRTTAHSPLYAERVPTTDATVVGRLEAAGGVLLGKLAMHEFAYGSPDLEGIFPPARNPWNIELIPGGSSSGSGTVVASGLCAGALGSDTGGSIRAPSSFCGIVGLKPTYGLVSRAGVVPLSWSLDCAGPMTRTVQDAAIMLQVLAGHDSADPASARVDVPDYRSALGSSVAGLRIGAPLSFVEAAPDLSGETMAAYREALNAFEQLGAAIRPVELPSASHAALIAGVIMAAEAFTFHERDVRERPDRFGHDFLAKILQGALLSASDYIQALRGRAELCQAVGEVMESVDLLILPTSSRPAWDFATEASSRYWARTSFTRLFSLTGQPALSIPCGFSREGLPIGLQLVGRSFAETTVLAAAHVYEQTSGWGERRPHLVA